MPPRFTVITATRDAADPALAWVRGLASTAVEVVVIANPGRCGLGQAYNEGLAQAHGDYCCFLHDDVTVAFPENPSPASAPPNTPPMTLANGWLERLAAVVVHHGVDLVGVAGGTIIPRNGGWWTAGVGRGRGTVTHHGAGQPDEMMHFGSPDDPATGLSRVVTLDGLLLFGRRRDFLAQPFDTALFDGFHFYDADLCLRWQLWGGKQIAVYHDLNVRHERGASLAGWQPYLDAFHYRHGGFLPLTLGAVDCWRKNFPALQQADPATANSLTASRRPGTIVQLDEPSADPLAVVNTFKQGASKRKSPLEVLVTVPEAGQQTLRDPEMPPLVFEEELPVFVEGIGTGELVASLLAAGARVEVIEPQGHLLCWVLCRFDWSEALAAGQLRMHVPAADNPALAEVALQTLTARWQRRFAEKIGQLRWLATGSTKLSASFFATLRAALPLAAQTRRRVAGWPPVPRPVFDVTVISPRCAIFDDLAGCFTALGAKTHLLTVPDHPGEWSATRWYHALRQLREQPAALTVVRNRVLLETPAAHDRLDLGSALPGRVVSWWWDEPNVASRIDWAEGNAGRPALAFARGLLPLLPAGSAHLPPGARRAFVALGQQPLATPPDLPATFVGQSRFAATLNHLHVLLKTLAWHHGRLGGETVTALNEVTTWRQRYEVLRQYDGRLAAALTELAILGPAVNWYLDYLRRMALTGALRLAAIEILAGRNTPLLVFGDEGWVRSGIVQPGQFGGVLPPARLGEVYRRSRLNLNLNFMQVSTTVNPKVLDISAAGALVLTDSRPELFELFPDSACRPFVFETLDKLPELVNDLLNYSTKERQDLGQALAAQVRGHHTLVQRASRLLAENVAIPY